MVVDNTFRDHGYSWTMKNLVPISDQAHMIFIELEAFCHWQDAGTLQREIW